MQPLRVALWLDHEAQRAPRARHSGFAASIISPGAFSDNRSAIENLRKYLADNEICMGNGEPVRWTRCSSR